LRVTWVGVGGHALHRQLHQVVKRMQVSVKAQAI
jgi:hypothetical protein